MTEVFLLQNQDKSFLSKKNEWVDGREPASLFKTPHKDEAVNQMFEVNAKDYSLRISLFTCPLNAKGVPEIPADALPERQPKAPVAEPEETGPHADEVSGAAESAEVEGAKVESTEVESAERDNAERATTEQDASAQSATQANRAEADDRESSEADPRFAFSH